jgi:hypothetical protein
MIVISHYDKYWYFLQADTYLGFDGGALLMFKFMMIFLTPSLFNLFKLRLFDGGAEDFLVNIMKQSIEQRRKKGDSSKRSDFVDLLVQAVKVSKDELDDTVVVQDQFDKDAKISSTFKGVYLSSMSEDEKEVLIISQTMILFLADFFNLGCGHAFLSYQSGKPRQVVPRDQKCC